MRSLRDRLAQFDRTPRPSAPAPAASAERVDDPLRALLDGGAEWVGAAPTGHLRIEETLDESPGPGWECVPAEAWRLFGAEVPRGDHWVVLDTETTGLESGTGTLVFLVGLVHWQAERVRRVQLFLPEPAGEAGFLEALSAELAPADALLSYNGRGFDVPRLRSRLRLQRMETAVLDRTHLDLLFPARRLLRHGLPDVRLQTLEREILGRPRHDDLPGEFAPEVYRCLLADARDTGLDAVVLHNARDVERLPPLARWLARCVGPQPPIELPPEGRLEAGRLHAERGDPQWACALFEELAHAPERELRRGARERLASMLRRAGRFDEAAAIWRAQVEEFPADLQARVELAKLCEHRLGDLEGAREAVVDALRRGREFGALGRVEGAGHDTRRELDHRLRRLRRKIARRGGDARG